MEGYSQRLDKEAITDSQDEYDHGVCPMDPNVMEYQNKVGVIIWLGVFGMVMHDALQVL